MAGEVRGEEQNRVGDFLWTGDFPSGMPRVKLLAKAANTLLLGVIAHPPRALHIGVGGARRNHITAHAATRQFQPNAATPAFSAAFDAP